MNSVKKENIISQWLTWHFAKMPQFLFVVWKNYLWFGLEYFSIPLLLATLISPFRHYKWKYPRGFDLGGYFGTFISNLFSRILGFLARIILIIIGLVAQLFIVVAGIIAIIFWFFMPLIIITLLTYVAYAV